MARTLQLAGLLLLSATVCARNTGLLVLSECICQGYNVTYECTVVGPGSTVWRGSSLMECTNNPITLFHSLFSQGTAVTCNGGSIVGRSVRVENNCYTSQLEIFVSSNIIGTTVFCSYDNGLPMGEMDVGNKTITLTTIPLQPPANVLMVNATSRQLIFAWDPVVSSCPARKYNIIATNCGSCPSNTRSTNITCLNSQPQPNAGLMCTFRVRTETCEGVTSGDSEVVTAILKVPDVPEIRIIPTYSQQEKDLLSLSVTVMELAPFFISNGIDGSAMFYNINYTNSTSGELCNSVTIPASSCTNGVCNHEFDISSSLCSPSTALSVTVFASNILGDGEVSAEFTFDEINNFVDVSFDTTTRQFLCTFINNQDPSEKSCSVILYRDCKEQDVLTTQVNSNETQIVLVVGNLQSDSSVYCYVVAASNDTITVNINGTITIGQTGVNPSSNTAAIVGGIFGALAFIICIALLILGAIYLGVRLGKIRSPYENTDGTKLSPVDDSRFIELTVEKDCELKAFIEDNNLKFVRGAAFYEFTRAEEDIKFDKEVILMDMKTKKKYTGRAACDKIGAPGEGIEKPKLKKYRVFVQSKGIGVRPLGQQSLVLYEHDPGPCDEDKNFDLIPISSNRQFKNIDVTVDSELREYIESHKKLTYKPGCTFFEFKSDKEDISERKEVLLMDKHTDEIVTGPGVLKMIGAPGRDIERPTLDRWRVFIQSMRGTRFIQEGSLLLYEDLGSDSENLELIDSERLEILDVKKTCSLRDFVEKTHQLVPYNPRRFFFEFDSANEDISDDKEIILIDKYTKQMFTGLKAKQMIGAPAKEVAKPSLNKYRVFIQNGGGGSRCLKPGTSLLYEKNYKFYRCQLLIEVYH